MTNKAAGMGYHRSENLATATPSRPFMLNSRSDHVTLAGNQMSSFQNHLFNIDVVMLVEVVMMQQPTSKYHVTTWTTTLGLRLKFLPAAIKNLLIFPWQVGTRWWWW